MGSKILHGFLCHKNIRVTTPNVLLLMPLVNGETAKTSLASKNVNSSTYQPPVKLFKHIQRARPFLAEKLGEIIRKQCKEEHSKREYHPVKKTNFPLTFCLLFTQSQLLLSNFNTTILLLLVQCIILYIV